MKKLTILLFVALFAISAVSLIGQTGNQKQHVEKPGTGYYTIDLSPKFNVKVNMVSFNHPNSGTKKVTNGSQVIGVQYAVWNDSEKEIKVRRNDFSVNEQAMNHYVVQEKETQPLVVKIPAGEAKGLINYYIVENKLQKLEQLNVLYSGVTKSYKKSSLVIPVIATK